MLMDRQEGRGRWMAAVQMSGVCQDVQCTDRYTAGAFAPAWEVAGTSRRDVWRVVADPGDTKHGLNVARTTALRGHHRFLAAPKAVNKAQVSPRRTRRTSCTPARDSAVLTLPLTLARDGHNAVEAADVFDAVEVLQRIRPTLEGKTEKQKNPHRSGSLAQFAWIIARLGRWKG
jgi:hypothetical protein